LIKIDTHLANYVSSQDRPILAMSHADWTIATSPKVLGALNLHRAFLKQPLDFFVLLGSANGIRGNHGQANYAAANTFLTTFVRYRQQLNLPASILDMGPVEDVGILSENTQLMDGFRRVGAEMVVENEFLDSFHQAIQSSHLPPESAPTITSGFVNRAQVIIGRIQRPFDARAQGLARIYNGTRIDAVVTEQSSGMEKEDNAMQKFMENARANPQAWAEDAATSETFLAKQILEAAKGLLIFDDDGGDDGPDDDSELDLSSSLSDLAIDSLLAIELQNWWRQSMGTQISVLELMKDASVLELGKLARAKILGELNIEVKS
jgi:aryl carrier-like protein